VSTDFPALPPGDALPTLPELAALLAGSFPAEARAAAATTLTDEVLAWDLRNLAIHARPRTLVELAYLGLAAELGPDAAQRPARLGDVVCDRRGQRLTRRIHGLAVARYLRGRGGKTPAGAHAADVDAARPFLALAAAAFDAEVSRAAAEKAVWERDAQAHPGCLKAHRIARIHDGFALDNARSGQFQAASGQVEIFLRNVGERPRRIDVH
jgi:hypothetical protein